MSLRSRPDDPVWTAFRDARGPLVAVGLFSGVLNILALTGSIYMLQVYDRAIPSKSIPTLVGISILMVALFVGYGLLDFLRTRAMSRIGLGIDRQLRDRVFEIARLRPLTSNAPSDAMQPVRDLDQMRSFMSGLGPTALLDIPWIPIFLVCVSLLHPWLGLLALAGAFALIALALVTDMKTRAPSQEAAASGAKRMAMGEALRAGAESIQALGMGERMGKRWSTLSADHVRDQLRATDAATGSTTTSRVFRMLLQSCVLGLGAYLVIIEQMSGGAIIAASIMTSRALAPIETGLSHWRGFVAARQSYARLQELFRSEQQRVVPSVQLGAPSRSVAAQNLTLAAPGSSEPILRGVSFQLKAGQGLGVIGPSGSGKSTLARALVGIWQPSKAEHSVRLDGAAIGQWTAESLGPHIGYLSQDIELLDGTIAENIARFQTAASSEDIIKAAKLAGAHDDIVGTPNGYATRLGSGGVRISGGLRQRIALARALYGDPFLVVLDEPNSNLDARGEQALAAAISSVRERGGIVVVIAHRAAAIASVDTLLALSKGQVQALGPKDEVLQKVTGAGPKKAPTKTANQPERPGALKVVKLGA
jgi:ATP-binding cassette subfamily C protein PrsD